MASDETKQMAAQRARERTRVARWDLNVAVFLFAILIIVIILLFQGVTIEIVAPIDIFGLAMVWLVGWRRGRLLYERFYNEELSKLRHGPEKTEEKAGVPQQASGTIDIRGLMLTKENCPRCNGALLVESDMDGYSFLCINCGYSKSVSP